ncbi:MAG: hypothetical protein LBT59_18705 [Clostridiales bacterium]|nr:hypothetical protein [Clostridiales bacterium]
MRKRWIAIALSAIMILGLAACGAKEAPATPAPEVSAPTAEPTESPTKAPTEAPAAEPAPVPEGPTEGLTAGIFSYLMKPEGREPMLNFIHFYDSGVFYASLYGGSQYAAGFYEVKEESKDYETGPEGSVENLTANKTIVLAKVDGSPYATVGYDEANDRIADFEPLYNNEFQHDYQPDPSQIEEQGVTISEYMLDGDTYSTVQLKHNGTFIDTVGSLIEGQWTNDGNTYTLTDADSGKSYSMALSGDALTAAYTSVDGLEFTLALIRDAQIVLDFNGSATHSSYGDAHMDIECYDNGEAKLTLTVGGAGNPIPGGAWELDEAGTTATFDIDGQEYTSVLEGDNFTFDYVFAVGGEELTFKMSTASEVTLSYTFTGEGNSKITLAMYSDGSCELNYEGMGTVTTGTWSVDASSGPLPKWTVELEKTFEGQPIEVTSDYATKFSFAFKNESGQLEETLSLSFGDYQAANGEGA